MLTLTFRLSDVLSLRPGWVVLFIDDLRHPIDLGADSVRSVVLDSMADELLMGFRYAAFNHATHALGGSVTVQRFDVTRGS